MPSDYSFGGSNRGPAAERRKIRPKRSNVFVDLAALGLLLGCGGAIAFQYWPLFSTTGYNVASGQLNNAGLLYYGYSSYGVYHRPYGRSRGGWFNMMKADYTFTANGKQYHSTVVSLPVIEMLALDTMSMTSESRANGLPVRYDPANPEKNVSVLVINHFGKAVAITYVCLFLSGMVAVILAGMSNISGEIWRPGRHNDVY